MDDETGSVETNFGMTVRKLRRQRRLSQARLGKRAGLHRTYIGGIERGDRNPSLKNIVAIAVALGVPTAALFPSSIDQSFSSPHSRPSVQ